MAKDQKRKKGRRRGRGRGTTARANADLGAHLESLGLTTIEAYKSWCRAHGLTAALNKTWQERRQERAVHEKDQQANQAEAVLMLHIKELRLEDLAGYQAWCRQQGLSDSIHKSPAQRSKEVKLQQRVQSDQALHKVRKHTRHIGDGIEQICAGEIAVEEELRTDVLRLIFRTFAGLAGAERTRLRDLLLLLENKAKILLDARPVLMRLGQVPGNTYLEALAALVRHGEAWLRDPADWKPESRNGRRQFAALARHLLASYEVPACLDSVWFGGCDAAARYRQQWFIHVGAGQNIRTANLPLTLSKRMAHVFPQAPGELIAEEALRWAQVVGQEGSEELASAILATELGRDFTAEDFWSTVVHFLVEHPMLDPDMVGPIIDYIRQQKFVPSEIVLPDGTMAMADPPQPDYTMKGRGAVKLLRQVDEWHERLARDNRQPGGTWEPSGIGGFEWADDKELGLRWTIRELTTKKELTIEGRTMNHCVASYVPNCQRGSKSIWSVQVDDATGFNARVATVAVHNPSRNIVEVRGRFNAVARKSGNNPKNRSLQQAYRELLERSGKVMRQWMETEQLGRTLRSY